MMKELASVVYDLVSGNRTSCRSHLSQPEQTALADLEALLRLSPQDLARLLTQTQDTLEWLEK